MAIVLLVQVELGLVGAGSVVRTWFSHSTVSAVFALVPGKAVAIEQGAQFEGRSRRARGEHDLLLSWMDEVLANQPNLRTFEPLLCAAVR